MPRMAHELPRPPVVSTIPPRRDDVARRRDPSFAVSFGIRVVGLLVLLELTWCVLSRGVTYARWPGSAVLGVVDGANFFFHEAGHLLFMFFGEFLTILGGSLNQLVIPALCTVQFVRQRQTAAASVGLFWIGESLTGVALYAADAKARRLPLHGDVDGSGSNHDWFALLSRTGLLDRAEVVGGVLFTIAVLLIVASVATLALDCLALWRSPHRVRDVSDS